MVSNLSRRAKPAALFATCKGFFSRLRNNQGFAQNLRRRIWISSSAHFSRKEKQQPLLLRAPSGRRATLCDHRWGRTRRIEAARARLPRGPRQAGSAATFSQGTTADGIGLSSSFSSRFAR
jgi:hypothetical protein